MSRRSPPKFLHRMNAFDRCATCYKHRRDCLGHAHAWHSYGSQLAGDHEGVDWIAVLALVLGMLVALVGYLVLRFLGVLH